MKKLLMTTLIATAAVASAQAADVGLAVSGTVNAGAEKVGQAVETVKGSYHEEIAKQNYESAKKELNSGNIGEAIEDASSSLAHEADAKKANAKADKHKKEADKAIKRAKVGAGIDVSASADVKK